MISPLIVLALCSHANSGKKHEMALETMPAQTGTPEHVHPTGPTLGK